MKRENLHLISTTWEGIFGNGLLIGLPRDTINMFNRRELPITPEGFLPHMEGHTEAGGTTPTASISDLLIAPEKEIPEHKVPI
jgi:hypothetical protein